MIKFWNFTLYIIWNSLNKISLFVQEGILQMILFLFPPLKKKKSEIRKGYRPITTNKDLGFNISFAFGILFLIWVVIYATLFMVITDLFDIQVLKTIKLWLLIIAGCSVLTNYLISWKKDIYLTYFSSFEKKKYSSTHYLSIFTFISSILLIAFWYVLNYHG